MIIFYVGYNMTIFPNIIDHSTQAEAGLELIQYTTLVSVSCILRFFDFNCDRQFDISALCEMLPNILQLFFNWYFILQFCHLLFIDLHSSFSHEKMITMMLFIYFGQKLVFAEISNFWLFRRIFLVRVYTNLNSSSRDNCTLPNDVTEWSCCELNLEFRQIEQGHCKNDTLSLISQTWLTKCSRLRLSLF